MRLPTIGSTGWYVLASLVVLVVAFGLVMFGGWLELRAIRKENRRHKRHERANP